MQRYGERAGGHPSPDPGARWADPGPDTDRAARWTVRLLAAALFVAVIAVVLRLTLLSLDDESPSGAKAPGGEQAPPQAAVVEDLGPEPGVDLVAYTQSRRAALAAATGERVAVVSLGAYSTQAQAKALLGSTQVVALLVAPPGMAPAVVVGDLGNWTIAQTKTIREERDEIGKLIPTVTDQAFKSFYTAEVERLDKAANALTPTSPIVFGVVVRGPAQALQALGARTEVRLVDVAEGSQSSPQATYRGLRPEEQAKANEPSTRPE